MALMTASRNSSSLGISEQKRGYLAHELNAATSYIYMICVCQFTMLILSSAVSVCFVKGAVLSIQSDLLTEMESIERSNVNFVQCCNALT